MLLARVALAALSFSGMAASAPAMSLIPSMGIASPDGRILVEVTIDSGQAAYTVSRDGKPVLGKSRLGVVRDDADFTSGLSPTANYSKRVATSRRWRTVTSS